MLLFASGLLASALQPQRRAAAFHRRDALGLGLGLAVPAVAMPALAAPAVAASTYASSTKLADGLVFPLASFGLQIYDDATAEQLTLRALEAGYRNFFASALAQNQRGFARGVRASGIARDELFICGSVVSNRALDAETAYKLTANGCAENAEAFAAGDIGMLDMIMLDYPGQDDSCIRAQWRAFEDFKEKGGAKSLAVSNFSPAQLDAILKEPGVQRRARPTVNQLPLCVGYHDPGIIAANQRRGIHVQAWSPLGNGRLTRRAADAPEAKQACAEVGAKYGKTAYQVALRWVTQSGASFTVEAKSAKHFAENLALFDFELDAGDMAKLEAINQQPRYERSVTGPDA